MRRDDWLLHTAFEIKQLAKPKQIRRRTSRREQRKPAPMLHDSAPEPEIDDPAVFNPRKFRRILERAQAKVRTRLLQQRAKKEKQQKKQ